MKEIMYEIRNLKLERETERETDRQTEKVKIQKKILTTCHPCNTKRNSELYFARHAIKAEGKFPLL